MSGVIDVLSESALPYGITAIANVRCTKAAGTDFFDKVRAVIVAFGAELTVRNRLAGAGVLFRADVFSPAMDAVSARIIGIAEFPGRNQ